MNPEDYTDEMLNQQFAMVRGHDDNSLLGKTQHFRSNHKGLYWGIPATFTLREARDNLGLSKSKLEKLRRVRAGNIVQMNTNQHEYNCWWALKLDNASFELQNQINELEIKLKETNAKIRHLAGGLIKEANKMQKELRCLKQRYLHVKLTE